MRKQGWAREGQEKKEDRQLILNKLCTAVLWSFRGSTAKKWFTQGECPG